MLFSLRFSLGFLTTGLLSSGAPSFAIEGGRVAKIHEPVVFPNLVPPQALQQVSHLPTGEAIRIDFVTGTPSAHQIKIPSHGLFKLVVQAGEHFQIVDQDASGDGMAKLTVPSQIFDIYLRPENDKDQAISEEPSVQFEDSLYYVKQKLSSRSEGNWYKLQGRPIPIPANWQNAEGDAYTHTITNSGFSHITSYWFNGEKIHLPLGVATIGSEGGLVELPGVARLVIPSNALRQSETISIRQIDKALPPQSFELLDPIFAYVSPVIKLEPYGLFLLKPAVLSMKTLVDSWPHHHDLIQMLAMVFLPVLNQESSFEMLSFDFDEDVHIDDEGFLVNHLAYFAKVTSPSLLADTQAHESFENLNAVVKSIGPEGGRLDLPGVGTLVIPPGALDKRQVITMRQIESAFEPYNSTYASQVVCIEPLGLRLNKAATIKLKTLLPFWQHHPSLVQFLQMNELPQEIRDAKDVDLQWENQTYLPFNHGKAELEALHLDDVEYLISRFSFGAKVVDTSLLSLR